jgi:ABC-type uncharacterized transport system substrate-binding protein
MRRGCLLLVLVLAGSGLLTGCERSPSTDQPAVKIHRIGFLGVGTREGRAFLIEGFLQGLREQGYVEGRNIDIEYRFSEDKNERLPELAADLVDRNVELIVASGSPASFAAKQATSTIPIVMGSLAANPVETGLIESLARPGGMREYPRAASRLSRTPSARRGCRRGRGSRRSSTGRARPSAWPGRSRG